MTMRATLISSLWFAVLLLSLASPARAVLKDIEQAYELAPAAVRVPTVSEGNLTLFPCAKCPPVSLRVTPATAWFTAVPPGRATSQDEFLKIMRKAAANRQTLIYVYYEPRTRRVTRLVLDAPAAGGKP